MEFLLGIVGNLVAALLGFWAGQGWRSTETWWRHRQARRFWMPFLEGELQVIIGRFLEFSSFEDSGLMGVGDAMGLTELRRYVAKLGLRDFSVTYADSAGGDSLKTNLILLGGPDVNSVTREVINKLGSTFRLGNHLKYEIAIRDTTTGRVFAPVQDFESLRVEKDYCLILKTTNPHSPRNHLLLVAGCFGFGTWAGIQFTSSQEFLTDKMVSAGKPIECLIEADVARGTPQHCRVIALRELP
jgi:hypothetical protein